MAPLVRAENYRPNVTKGHSAGSLEFTALSVPLRAQFRARRSGLMTAVDRRAAALTVISERRCLCKGVDIFRASPVPVRVVTRGNRAGRDQS